MSQTNDVTVRPLRPEDYSAWCALWDGYLTFYQSEVTDEVYQTTFARLLGDDPCDFSALVAEQSGVLIGLTHFLFHRHAWRVEDVCYLQDLFVSTEARGSGAGEALMRAVYAAADAHGAGSVYWLTQEFNDTARRLYDRVGVITPFIKYQRA